MLNVTNLFKQTNTVTDLTLTDTTVIVNGWESFIIPAGGHFYALLQNNNNTEVVKVTSAGDDGLWRLTRAQDSTTARAWKAGTCVTITWTPSQLNEFMKGTPATALAPPVPLFTAPFTKCLSEGMCITVDTNGHITAVTDGASC